VCGACVLLTPLALAAPPAAAPAWPATLALLALALPCTVLAYLIYFRLIANIGPTKASVVTFLIPPFGILWGVAFLDEPLNAGVLAGLGIILASVWLVLGARK
jgi:drug/metabolite transporter (DMT)-like permease